jgi:hypothetical protein
MCLTLFRQASVSCFDVEAAAAAGRVRALGLPTRRLLALMTKWSRIMTKVQVRIRA